MLNNGSFGPGLVQNNDQNFANRNPLMPQHAPKNTRTERLGTINQNYRINLEQEYLEGIAIGTYIKECSVYDYFL